MIVFKTSERPAFGGKEYSHIECDVPDCGKVSPPQEELNRLSLFQRGWHIAGGQHRCPEHVNEEIAARGPVVRAADGSEGFVR